MLSAPLTCSSMGAATLSEMTSALAPGYVAETVTWGGVMSGYWAMGRLYMATRPAMTITMEMTDAKMGRSMKKWEIMGLLPSSSRLCGGFFPLRFHGRGRSLVRRPGFPSRLDDLYGDAR